MLKVIKRNGSVEPFDFQKIKNAVNKAFKAVEKADAPDDFIDYLETLCSTFNDDKSVEEIQDFVEKSLMEHKWYDVAKAYILYREKHENVRN